MKITLDLPQTLHDELLRIFPKMDLSTVIISALQDYVRKTKIQDIKQYKGKVPLDIDMSKLRDQKGIS